MAANTTRTTLRGYGRYAKFASDLGENGRVVPRRVQHGVADDHLTLSMASRAGGDVLELDDGLDTCIPLTRVGDGYKGECTLKNGFRIQVATLTLGEDGAPKDIHLVTIGQSDRGDFWTDGANPWGL